VTTAARIPFAELRPGRDRAEIAQAIDRVMARGWFVLGPEVEAFETEFAVASGAAHAIGVASGTDAIALALRALDLGPGDEVIVPAMTAAFTGLAVASIGATPVIVDVDSRTLTIDLSACEAAVSPRTRAVVPVHLYGQPADTAGVLGLAARHGLAVIEDCCQAHLATAAGVPVGTAGTAGAFSFYPTKNLGALGDGGAVVTSDAALAQRIRRLRNGGQAGRYQHVEAGVNSRLDELQAAVLRVRLQGLADATAVRRDLARAYRLRLGAGVTPVVERDPGHVYHLFPVRSPERATLMAFLQDRGIETLVHYPVPLSSQPAFARYHPRACPVAGNAAAELLSLPLNPRLSKEDVTRVADTVNEFSEGRGNA
jgi:dTDP-3-amino-3,4,6-trideoxy-alpha-D-glucose transaminase